MSHNTREGNHRSSASHGVASSLLQVAPSREWPRSQRSPLASMILLLVALVGMPCLQSHDGITSHGYNVFCIETKTFHCLKYLVN